MRCGQPRHGGQRQRPSSLGYGIGALSSLEMQRRPYWAHSRVVGLLATSVALAATVAACPGVAAAARPHPSTGAASFQERAAAARVARYWTPARMRSARPLDLVVESSGKTRLRVGAAETNDASASFRAVSTPDTPPYSFNGRIFIRRGNLAGFCSGTAINTATRQLVLTAGHCVNSGREDGKASVWSNYLQFVPAYDGGVAPFGSFVARREAIRAPRQWTKQGNPDFDLGAFLTLPNSEGLDVADAVGGGATIVTGLTRHQTFQSYGYPGETKHMQQCTSPYIGDDLISNPLPGPPTLGIDCHWAPGASGGGWLIGDGTQINGVSTYLHLGNKSRTFGPYFSAETVGKLVKGF
jgi:V8-like Glu-specific endopeptidase